MIDKICEIITNKISKENPDFDEARLEVINYGLQLIIGEIPKMFLAIALAFILGVGKYTLITLACLIPYRGFSGGFHLKTHIGCFICTTAMYCIPGVLAKYLPIIGKYKYISVILLFIFAIQMHSNVILYSFYLISILLFIVSFLALYKNLKNNNKPIFIFVMFISVILVMLCTYFIII